MHVLLFRKLIICIISMLILSSTTLASESEKTAIQWLEEGNSYLKIKEYDNAILVFFEAIKMNPVYAMAYNNRGIAYSKKLEYSKAIEDYTKAIELNPNLAEAYLNRGEAYAFYSGYYWGIIKAFNISTLPPQYIQVSKKQINDYNTAIELAPDYAAAYNSRGLYYYHRDNFDQAIADFSKVIDLCPNDEMAYYNRGRALTGKLQSESAVQDFNKSITINPSIAGFYNSRGQAYIQLKQYQQAIIDFNRSIEINPKQDPLIYFNLAQTYEILGSNTEAIKYYEESYKRMSAFPKSHEKFILKAQCRLVNDWSSYKEWL